MSQFAILGSGFGLYGYLAALISCEQKIILPERYRSRFYTRPELISFADQIKWLKDENTLLEHTSGIVLALQPGLQKDWLPKCLARKNIEYLLLEKPLAPSPDFADHLFDMLIRSGKPFRIGYTFRYTVWGKHLLAKLKASNTVKISLEWNFLAHHFRENLQTWKRSHFEGGGVIRFYGIHIIALLAELGYREVALSHTTGLSADECEKWCATFKSDGLPLCEVIVDSRASIKQFQIGQTFYSSEGSLASTSIVLRDPFDENGQTYLSSALDYRVPMLCQLCYSLLESDINDYDWYAQTIKLWHIVEDKTLFNCKDME